MDSHSGISRPQSTDFNGKYATRLKVFISHITKEAEIAQRLAKALDEDFHGVLEVFASSRHGAIEAGEEWLLRLEKELNETSVLLVLCSRESIKTSWVNLEVGGAWLRKTTIIPICHNGLTPNDLEIPYKLWQGVILNDIEGLSALYLRLASILGWGRPPKLTQEIRTLAGEEPDQKPRWRHTELIASRNFQHLAASDPYGYTFGDKQHVVYRGADNHIHELWSVGWWNHEDLTNAAEGAVDADGNPRSYFHGSTHHIIYRGKDNHIHELWWRGRWLHADLTPENGIAPPAIGDPTGYEHGNSQHVVYWGKDGCLHELWWNGAWQHFKILDENGSKTEDNSSPTGYAIGRKQHVIYRGGDGNVYELWWNGQWNLENLTKITGAPPAGGTPHAYIHDDKQHIVYRSDKNEIIELWWKGNWRYTNLTSISGLSAISDPVGYIRGLTQRVVFLAERNRIKELSWDGHWQPPTDLTEESDTQNARGLKEPTGNPTSYALHDTQHVIYRDKEGVLHELGRI